MLNHLGIILFIVALAAVGSFGLVNVRSKTSTVIPKITAGADAHPSAVSLWMQVIVSLAILAASLYIILSQGFQGDQQKWAFGAVGTVLGFWLKS